MVYLFLIGATLSLSAHPALAQGRLDERRSLAEQGDRETQFGLGQAYRWGIGVEKNFEEAIRWYEMAANRGDADAMFELGNIVAHGFAGDDESPEAVKATALYVEWFRRAAVLGNTSAQSSLGLLYGFGDRVERDEIIGRMWLYIAQDNGEAPSPCSGISKTG